MHAEAAWEIQRVNRLIDRKTSKKILSEITHEKILDLSSITCPNMRRKIELLKYKYQDIVKTLGGNPRPRNLPFYLMIKEQYPKFQWEQMNKKNIMIDFYFQGIKPSLLSLLLSLIPEQETSIYRQLYERFEVQDAGIIASCLEVFKQEDVLTPSDMDMRRLLRWIQQGKAGQQITIVSPVCPDYETVAGTRKTHRFTFNGLGSGIGVTAARLFKSLPALHRLFTESLGLQQLAHFVCVGDFEAFVPDNLQRLGLDEEAFLVKVRASCHTIAQKAPAPVIAQPFTSLCGGKAGWFTQHTAIATRFQACEFGALRDNPLFQAIARARQPLYDRWFQVKNQKLSFYENLVVCQGIEYTTMGKIIEESSICPNPLILGADHHKMAPFYNFAADLPVLYLRRNYE